MNEYAHANDLGHSFEVSSGAWRTAADYRDLKSVMSANMNGDSVLISVDAELPVFAIPYKTTYTVYKSGAVKVDCSMDINNEVPQLPRFGVQFRIPENYGITGS